MAVFIVCAVNGEGMREVVAIEPMMEEPASRSASSLEVCLKLSLQVHCAILA